MYKPKEKTALAAYEAEQERIEKLLAKIQAGLEAHDRKASLDGGHHWGHAEYMRHIAVTLQDLSDSLYGEGEYAQ
jgi:hypothetical protein